MPQPRKRRRTKHRGNAVGMIEARGRTGRKPEASERRSGDRDDARARRERRMTEPPSWRAALNRALISAAVFVALLLLLFHQSVGRALLLGALVTLFYLPLGFYTDRFVYRRRMARRAR